MPIPTFAQSAAWVFKPIPFIEACHRRFGDVFTLRFAGMRPIVAISDPGMVKEIFTGDPAVFNAGRGNFVLKPILGANSLLLLDGDRHLKERRLLMPAFHGERMQTYKRVMQASTDRSIDGWPSGSGKPFPIHHEMQVITLDVILRAVFGVEGDAEQEIREALLSMLAFGEHPSLLMLIGRDGEVRGKELHERLGRLSPWNAFGRVIQRVDTLLSREVEKRRLLPPDEQTTREDVLSLLLTARDEEGVGLTTQQLADEMKTMLVAGHETSATALTWTILELIRNPPVLGRLREDIARGSDEYLEAVVRESLRLHPIVPMVARYLEEPVTLTGSDGKARSFPADTVLAPNIYLTHRSAKIWRDPERFEPDRFLHNRANPYEFFPFGGGVRRCIGLAFALFEMKTVLRQIVTRVDLELAPNYTPKLTRRGITFAVSKGLPVIARRCA